MEDEITSQDKQRIEENIRGKYIKVAASPEGFFRYPTGRAGLEALDYPPDMARNLPERRSQKNGLLKILAMSPGIQRILNLNGSEASI